MFIYRGGTIQANLAQVFVIILFFNESGEHLGSPEKLKALSFVV
jgi:hypothetical protein